MGHRRSIQEVDRNDETAISKRPRECFKKGAMVHSDERLREITENKVSDSWLELQLHARESILKY